MAIRYLKTISLTLLLTALSGCRQSRTMETLIDAAGKAPAEHLDGEKIYKQNCALCHDGGEAGAPRIGNPLQWDKRVSVGAEVLTQHAVDGFEGKWGEMPPQGEKLPADEVGNAVRYMLYRYEQKKNLELKGK